MILVTSSSFAAPVSSVEEEDVLALPDIVKVVLRRLLSSRVRWLFVEEGGMEGMLPRFGFQLRERGSIS
jgi:hypothetical protein